MMTMSLTIEQKNAIIISLRGVCEDMFTCDREKSWSECKYGYTVNPFNYQDKSKKHLVRSLNYIRAYYKDEYLGIASRADPRFDENGQYIEEST